MVVCTFPRKGSKIGPMVLNEEVLHGEHAAEIGKMLFVAACKAEGIVLKLISEDDNAQGTA